MDSWLFDNHEDRPDDSESDSEQTQTELEARLYSIVHHNDLSQPLPPELAKHYTIACTDSGEVEVILKDSLEELKTEECKKVNQVSISSEFNTENLDKTSTTEIVEDDDVVIISDGNRMSGAKNSKKRFRYSDVNLDSSVESQNNTTELISPIPIFSLSDAILNHNYREFNHLNIPTFDSSDWKTKANASFISLEDERADKKSIIKKMTEALLRVNPGEKMNRLSHFADYLYKRQLTILKRKRKRDNRKNLSVATPLSSKSYKTPNNTPVCEKNKTPKNNTPVCEKKNHRSVNKRNKTKSKGKINGSISLDITPFRPDTSMADLVSEDEETRLCNRTNTLNEMKLSYSSIPDKWSPRMVKFYTARPNKRLVETDNKTILDNLKKTTIKSDWWMVEQDWDGKYKNTLRDKSQRCANCRQFGHCTKFCPRPKRSSICILCGGHTHNKFNCPDKVCIKCGVFVKNKTLFDDECSSCYYSAFNNPTPCNVCGQINHRSKICPDLWRSYHATTVGKKKIPHIVRENVRKYCCNCGLKGHYSHHCKLPMNSLQQISPFVRNYSGVSSEKGSSEVIIPKYYSHIIDSPETDSFLQKLSNNVNTPIFCETTESGYVVTITGTFSQCHRVTREVEDYVNVKKRKRIEPPLPIIKRQRIH